MGPPALDPPVSPTPSWPLSGAAQRRGKGVKRPGSITRVFLFAWLKVCFLTPKYKKPGWGCAAPLAPLLQSSRRNICSSTRGGMARGPPLCRHRPARVPPAAGEGRAAEGRGRPRGKGKGGEGRAGRQLLLAEPELVSCSLSPGCAQLRSLPTPRSVPQFPPPRGCGGEWRVRMGRASLGVGGGQGSAARPAPCPPARCQHPERGSPRPPRRGHRCARRGRGGDKTER